MPRYRGQCPPTSIKYLLECYFKNTGFSILMIFAATFARLVMSALRVLRPNVVAIDAVDDCAVAASGVLYVGARYTWICGAQG
jgi:hypothetical protein